jgi:hypothetical protein
MFCPEYSPTYYGLFFEDPSGNCLEVCSRYVTKIKRMPNKITGAEEIKTVLLFGLAALVAVVVYQL